MDSSFSDILENIFEKQKKDYLTFTSLKSRLPASIKSVVSIDVKKTSNKDLEEIIKPYLPAGYIIYVKGNTRYLFRKSLQEVIISYLKANPNLSLNQVKANLPFKREELAEIINNLVDTGNAKTFIIAKKDGFGTRISIIDKNPDIKKNENIAYTPEAFKEGFNAINKGKPYIKIFELRRFLAWPSSSFDTCMQSLWDAGVIELQASDPSLLTADQQRDSYRDKSNTLRILLFWRGE
ncbi:hypothetical protein KHC33_11990 [Methanospirillum sp. J.3.6.1-F.2.7.3]|uniref:Uncharacterized protein n=1 Tax=Methanospirillum purgamenti TaxID=2834276 RepID=A0A8E7EJ39_9EURY|nr:MULTISPECIES: hypothetical protein [Methanospirillum]MDX8550285.1 hypothetical protein [Methanospirillum hungatei]QVV88050.1 hypothetical protein KHC33_11990 [Methanospirillum sp. J.3.6.1-F.2.7.3]